MTQAVGQAFKTSSQRLLVTLTFLSSVISARSAGGMSQCFGIGALCPSQVDAKQTACDRDRDPVTVTVTVTVTASDCDRGCDHDRDRDRDCVCLGTTPNKRRD